MWSAFRFEYSRIHTIHSPYLLIPWFLQLHVPQRWISHWGWWIWKGRFECWYHTNLNWSIRYDIVASLPKEQQIFRLLREVVDRTEDQLSCSNFNWAKGADVDGANIADDSIASHQIEIASCSGLDVELGRLFLTELSSQRDLVM